MSRRDRERYEARLDDLVDRFIEHERRTVTNALEAVSATVAATVKAVLDATLGASEEPGMTPGEFQAAVAAMSGVPHVQRGQVGDRPAWSAPTDAADEEVVDPFMLDQPLDQLDRGVAAVEGFDVYDAVPDLDTRAAFLPPGGSIIPTE